MHVPPDLRRRDARFAAVLQEALLASRVYEGDAGLQKKCQQKVGMRCRHSIRQFVTLVQVPSPWQQKVFQGMVSSKFISQSLREFRLQAPSGPQSQAKRELLANNVLRNLSTNLPKNQCFRMSESSQVKWIPDNDQTTE